jgi:predicted nucleic acid-binding Zn ribbon protein
MVGTDKYCSDECRTKRENLIRKKKRQLLMLYFGSFIAFAVLIVLWLWGA